jgi:lambda family phage portal protein
MASWGLSTYGPNTLIGASLTSVRARSRYLTRNNPLAENGVEAWVSNLIGTGIIPRWQIENKELKNKIQLLWKDWTEQADYDGTSDFYGLQSIVSRSLVESGECLARFHYMKSQDDFAVPLQIQLLEPDHLDESYEDRAKNGNQIRMSIEFDRRGKRAAYHVFANHPGESSLLSYDTERIRVPASEMLHIFRPLRPGQARGRPWLTSIIVALKDLDTYGDAERVRKLGAAMFGGFITEPPGENVEISTLGKKSSDDSQGRDVIALEPGTFPTLPPGCEVKFSEPTDVGGNYEAWIKQQVHEIAAGLGLTYEMLTGDLTDVNYSSIRAGLLEFRRRCEALQWHTIIFQFCQPILRRWFDISVASGALQISDYLNNSRDYHRVDWRPQGWKWVDPLKDGLAAQLATRCGYTSRSAVVAEQGLDTEDIDRQQAEDNQRADGAGLIYDSDSRKTEKSGTLQKIEEKTTEKTIEEANTEA